MSRSSRQLSVTPGRLVRHPAVQALQRRLLDAVSLATGQTVANGPRILLVAALAGGLAWLDASTLGRTYEQRSQHVLASIAMMFGPRRPSDLVVVQLDGLRYHTDAALWRSLTEALAVTHPRAATLYTPPRSIPVTAYAPLQTAGSEPPCCDLQWLYGEPLQISATDLAQARIPPALLTNRQVLLVPTELTSDRTTEAVRRWVGRMVNAPNGQRLRQPVLALRITMVALVGVAVLLLMAQLELLVALRVALLLGVTLTIATTALLYGTGLWLPFNELIAIMGFAVIAGLRWYYLTERHSLALQLIDLRRALADLPTQSHDFRSEQYWHRLDQALSQILGLHQSLIFELRSNGRFVTPVPGLSVSADDIVERRRDVDRAPFSTASQSMGPIQIGRFLRDDSNRHQYLLALRLNGVSHGFWVFSVAHEDQLSAALDASPRVGAIAAEALALRATLLENRERFTWLAPGPSLALDLEHSVLALMQRNQMLEGLIHNQRRAVLLWDLNGRLLQSSDAAAQLLAGKPVSTDSIGAFLGELTDVQDQDLGTTLRDAVLRGKDSWLPGRYPSIDGVTVRVLRNASSNGSHDQLGLIIELELLPKQLLHGAAHSQPIRFDAANDAEPTPAAPFATRLRALPSLRQTAAARGVGVVLDLAPDVALETNATGDLGAVNAVLGILIGATREGATLLIQGSALGDRTLLRIDLSDPELGTELAQATAPRPTPEPTAATVSGAYPNRVAATVSASPELHESRMVDAEVQATNAAWNTRLSVPAALTAIGAEHGAHTRIQWQATEGLGVRVVLVVGEERRPR
ncbi:MAG: hypothetical protein AAF918_18260 [Pseudomonadota bacterium]